MTEAKIYVPTTDAKTPARTLQPNPSAPQIRRRTAARQRLRVLELSR